MNIFSLKFREINFSFFIFLFFISLQSYYFYSVGVSLFCYLGAFFFIFKNCINNSVVLKNDYIYIISSLFFLVLILIIYPLDQAKTIIGIIFCLIFMFFFLVDLRLNLDKIYKSILFVVLFHTLVYTFQALYWFVTKDYIDLLFPITGEHQRYVSEKAMNFGGIVIPRFTGLFNEPGTYSTVMMVLISCLFVIEKKINTIILFSLITIMLSMSLYGFVFVLGLVLFYIVSSFNLKSMVILSLIFSPLIFYIYPFIEQRLTSSNSGFEDRTSSIQNILSDYYGSSNGLIFGGFYNNSLASKDSIILNDLSLFVWLIYGFGVFGLIFIFIYFVIPIIFSRKIDLLILVILVLLSKLKFTYPLIWVFLSLIYIKSTQRS